ncbi:ABC transporter substrate-binding protein [Neorhizobium sp. T786]|uniref:ABC transporter substrate-binding protein n=1 Tax=Pseudorhizobium xiangyangii TaxID=2883104 RepID=UPI001CFFB68A|nr:ABC transporter substrate-binding protein [Neorhizobium xiangyangii]MCB5204625.1 ABC transporter substrate-binding protein [Neorhizobium xiangyangii]
MADTLRLTISVRSAGHTNPVKNGTVKLDGIEFEFVEVEPQIAAYRRMVRDLEFDVCELASTTYYIARSHGAPYTALPIFFERKFHHTGLVIRPDAGITAPKDLEGKKVGVRAYSVTTGVWTRGVLQNEYGLDCSKVTWVVDDEEHVAQMVLPPNVVHAPQGQSLAQMMAAGELHAGFTANAGIGRAGPPTADWAASTKPADSYPELLANGKQAEAEWYARTGILPMHSTLVIRDEILASRPDVAPKIYNAFLQAKEIYMGRLHSGEAATKQDEGRRKLMKTVGSDPLPYGFSANRASIEALKLYAEQQQLMARDVPIDELFIDEAGF